MPQLIEAAARRPARSCKVVDLAEGLGHHRPVRAGCLRMRALLRRLHHLRGGAGHHQQRDDDGHAAAGAGDRHHAGHRRAAPLRAGMVLRRDGGPGPGLRRRSARCWARSSSSLGWTGGIPAANDTLYFFFSGPAPHPPRSAPATSSPRGHRGPGVDPLHPLPGRPRDAGLAARGDADGRVNRCATDLLIAVRNLAQHRRRTLLLGGGHRRRHRPAGRCSAACPPGCGRPCSQSATTLMTGHVNVGGFYKVTAGTAAPVVTD